MVGPVERVEEVVGPWPGVREVEPVLSGVPGDGRGGVEQALAKPLGPHDQVLGAQHGGDPGLVDRERR